MTQNQINLLELNQMMNNLADKAWAQSDLVWSQNFCHKLAQECQSLADLGQLKKAAVGPQHDKRVEKDVRGDFTYWLDSDGATLIQTEFTNALRQIQQHLNETFFLGLKSFESHFALYPPGSGYDKHIDNHRGSSSRKMTFVLYLNENWQSSDGGQLTLFDPSDESLVVGQVKPSFANFVLFRSELFPHQVETSFQPRLSLTDWFRDVAL